MAIYQRRPGLLNRGGAPRRRAAANTISSSGALTLASLEEVARSLVESASPLMPNPSIANTEALFDELMEEYMTSRRVTRATRNTNYDLTHKARKRRT